MRISFWTIAILLAIRLLTLTASTSTTRVLAAERSDIPPGTAHLLPVPKSIAGDPYHYTKFDRKIKIGLSGYNDPRVKLGIQRFASRFHAHTGIEVQVEPFSKVGLVALAYSSFLRPEIQAISVDCAGSGGSEQSVDDDEGYRLDVENLVVRIRSRTAVGALRGLQTLEQLIQRNGNSGYTIQNIQIDDSPRFRWRGLLIDCSRHFISVDTLKRNLDLMERCKMNVFHWHLSDDQGFRVESKVFPRLQEYGSDGKFYTQAQIKGIIAYAYDRGIRVVPEFDMPGHSTSWFTGYPELASAPGPYAIQTRWGVFDPAMDPTRESTYTFLDRFVGEMAGLFPDQYFHIGGDEVNGRQWDANPDIQKFIHDHNMTSNADLQAYFNGRVHEILSKYHKTMVGWDEVLNPTISKEIVLQSWRGQKSLSDAAQLGHDAILSSGYYLDSLQPASVYYLNDPLGGDAAALSSDLSGKVIGGEACMWGEHISDASITDRVWPRTAAIAERLWSPVSVKDVESMTARIAQFDQRINTAEAAFYDKPATIPGTISAVDYDRGGEGISYHDTADYNAGAEYRPQDYVGIGDCSDAGNGHNLAFAAPGEWLKYTVDVKQAGHYNVHIRAASIDRHTKLHFEDVYGNRLGPDIEIPRTGGWEKWRTVDGMLTLTPGRQIIKLVEDTGNYNLNTFTFELAN